MTSEKEQTRRREVYQSLAQRANVDPYDVAKGMRELRRAEKAGLHPWMRVTAEMRERALRLRSGLPAKLTTEEIRTIAMLGSGS